MSLSASPNTRKHRKKEKPSFRKRVIPMMILKNHMKEEREVNENFVRGYFNPDTLEIQNFKIEHIAEVDKEVKEVTASDATEIILEFEKKKNARLERVLNEKYKNAGKNKHRVYAADRLEEIREALKKNQKSFISQAEKECKLKFDNFDQNNSYKGNPYEYDEFMIRNLFKDPMALYKFYKTRSHSRSTRSTVEAECYSNYQKELGRKIRAKTQREPKLTLPPVMSVYQKQLEKRQMDKMKADEKTKKLVDQSTHHDLMPPEEEEDELSKRRKAFALSIQEIMNASSLEENEEEAKKHHSAIKPEILANLTKGGQPAESTQMKGRRAINRLKGLLAFCGAKGLRKKFEDAERQNKFKILENKSYSINEVLDLLKKTGKEIQEQAQETTMKLRNSINVMRSIHNTQNLMTAISNSESKNLYYNYLYSVRCQVDDEMEGKLLKEGINSLNARMGGLGKIRKPRGKTVG